VVNLGNDFDAGDPGDEFDAAYVTLLRKIRYVARRRGLAQSVGYLSGGTYKSAKFSIFGAVETVRDGGDKKTHFVEFTPPPKGRRYGCTPAPRNSAQTFIAPARSRHHRRYRLKPSWVPKPVRDHSLSRRPRSSRNRRFRYRLDGGTIASLEKSPE
jgi:hypothetical protein